MCFSLIRQTFQGYSTALNTWRQKTELFGVNVLYVRAMWMYMRCKEEAILKCVQPASVWQGVSVYTTKEIIGLNFCLMTKSHNRDRETVVKWCNPIIKYCKPEDASLIFFICWFSSLHHSSSPCTIPLYACMFRYSFSPCSIFQLNFQSC